MAHIVQITSTFTVNRISPLPNYDERFQTCFARSTILQVTLFYNRHLTVFSLLYLLLFFPSYLPVLFLGQLLFLLSEFPVFIKNFFLFTFASYLAFSASSLFFDSQLKIFQECFGGLPALQAVVGK